MNLYAETAMIWHKNKSNSNGNARIKKKKENAGPTNNILWN